MGLTLPIGHQCETVDELSLRLELRLCQSSAVIGMSMAFSYVPSSSGFAENHTRTHTHIYTLQAQLNVEIAEDMRIEHVC